MNRATLPVGGARSGGHCKICLLRSREHTEDVQGDVTVAWVEWLAAVVVCSVRGPGDLGAPPPPPPPPPPPLPPRVRPLRWHCPAGSLPLDGCFHPSASTGIVVIAFARSCEWRRVSVADSAKLWQLLCTQQR